MQVLIMSMAELEVIAGFMKRAICPEDVFGKLGITEKERSEALKHSFRKLAKVLHPDSHNGDAHARLMAEGLFKELEKMRAQAEGAISKGVYGSRKRFPWKIPILIKGKYIIESPLCAGSIADLHLASMESSSKHLGLIIKIARNANDNDLLNAERLMLAKLHDKFKEHRAKDWPSTVPTISESFILDDGRKRRVNVMQHFDGFYDVAEIRKRLPQGVDGRTIAWMWKRLLVLLEWISKTGLIHGAILPPHVMFFPDNDGHTHKDVRKHAIRLVDWCYAVDFKARTRLSAWIPDYKDFYAPEVLAKKPLGPWTDLYMGARTMFFLGGGDNAGTTGMPRSIVDSLKKCMEPNPKNRPEIGKYFEEFTAVVKKEYGAPKYHDFNLPGI